MGLQRLTGVGISNIYYEENGNIRLTYYIDGDAMSGAGQVNIKIELDNAQVANSNVNASFPGRTSLNTTVGLSSRVPGSTHNIKITGTKNGVVRTASKSNTFPVQSDLDKIDINFTHRETIPEKILTDTFSFINIGNFGGVRFSIDEDVTDSSTKYETNSIQTIPNNDNKRHVINYRYKCGDLVATKSYTVDHSTSEPEHRVPYVYPNPVLTQVDNNHYEISIHDFTNDGSRYGVTDTSKIKVRVTYNNKYIDFDYADFTGNKLSTAYQQCLINRKFLAQNLEQYDVLIFAGRWSDIVGQNQQKGFADLLKFAEQHHKKVIVMSEPYAFDQNISALFKRALWLNLNFNLNQYMDNPKATEQIYATKVIDDIVSAHPNTLLLKRNDLFSPNQMATTNTPYSLDGRHMSIVGSLASEQYFEQQPKFLLLKEFILKAQ